MKDPVDTAIATLEASKEPLTLLKLASLARVAEGDASAALGRLYDLGRLEMKCVNSYSDFYGRGKCHDVVILEYSVKKAA